MKSDESKQAGAEGEPSSMPGPTENADARQPFASLPHIAEDGSLELPDEPLYEPMPPPPEVLNVTADEGPPVFEPATPPTSLDARQAGLERTPTDDGASAADLLDQALRQIIEETEQDE